MSLSSLAQLQRLTKKKAARARRAKHANVTLQQQHVLMNCLCCGEVYAGKFHKQKKSGRFVSKGLTQHLNQKRTEAPQHNQNTEEPSSEKNCFLWYRKHKLAGNRTYDLSTSRVTHTKSILPAPSHPPSNPAKNPFGLQASSTLLSRDEEFGPKDSYQHTIGNDNVANLSALNQELTHVHLENAFSGSAIREYLLLSDLVDREENDDFDAVSFSFDQQFDFEWDIGDDDGDEDCVEPRIQEDTSSPSTSKQTHVDGLSDTVAEENAEVEVRQLGGDAELASGIDEAQENTNVRTTLMDLLKEHEETHNLHKLNDPQLRMEVSLMQLCLKHRLPLSATEDFIDWARSCTKMKSNVFDAPTRKRKKILDDIQEALGVHGRNDFKETIVEWLPSRKPTSCFIRSFLPTVFELLHDTDIVGVGGSNLAFPHPTDPFRCEPESPQNQVSELCHASWFKDTFVQYCTKQNEILVPIVLAADESPYDVHSRLKVTPLLMTLGIIKKQLRRKRENWKVLAHLLDEDAESEKHDGPQQAKDKLQNLHNVIALALQELKVLHESGESVLWELEYGGQKHTVHIKFAIVFFVSDTEFHDKLCLSKGNYTNTSRGPCRICKVPIKYLVMEEMEYPIYDPAELDPSPSYHRTDGDFDNIGQHRCLNAFYSLPMGANKNNIHTATPPECLHAIEKGAQNRCIEALLYAIKNGSNIEFERGKWVAEKEVFQGIAVTKMEHLAKRVGASIQRQSERDKPRSKFGNGHFEKTKKTAREQAGVVLNLLIVMLSDRGRRILLEERGIHPEFLHKTVRVFKLLLQIDAWMKLDSFPADHVHDEKRVARRINEVVKLIRETCCREGMGANLIKNHLLFHLPMFLRMYGPPSQWDSGPIESFHKHFSKLPAKLTQQIVSVFQKQLAMRQNEMDIIGKAARYSNISNNGIRLVPLSDQNSATIKKKCGGSSFSVGCNTQGRGAMKWLESRNFGKPPHRQEVLNFVCQHVLPKVTRYDVKGRILQTIEGFTEYKTIVDGAVVSFRAHPSYSCNSGQKRYQWYDWAMIQRGDNSKVPGRILMFLKLPQVDSPISAPNGVFSISDDGTAVAIVQLFDDEPTTDFREGCSPGLAGHYSSMVEFGRISSGLDIVPCAKIVEPVIVVPNFSYEYEDELDPDHPNHGCPKLKRQRTKPDRSSDPLGRINDLDGFFVIPSRQGWAKQFVRWIDQVPPTIPEADPDMIEDV